MKTAFDRMQEVLVEAQKRSETFNGPCTTCRWRRPRSIDRDKCAHPIVVAQSVTINDAGDRRYLQECDEQRDTRSIWGTPLCRPEGLLWEERLPWWRRLLRGE